MGRELFDGIPEFLRAETTIDGVLGYSVRELCLSNPQNRLMLTQYTQPALFVVNYLYYCKLTGERGIPNYLAGHSLGELNALLASGAFDLMTGVRIVKMRGELMAKATNGTMAAIVGPTPSQVDQMLKDNSLSGIDVANYNSPNQTVVSGLVDDIARAEKIFTPHVDLFVQLAVSAAFHSRYMKEAADGFQQFLEDFQFNALAIPVICNVTARPYPSGSEIIREMLVKQIVNPVRWEESIRYLRDQGVRRFEEAGPGNILTRLLEQREAH
jgi:malonyl CoA-acyl carrier protein transacylase